MLPARIHWSITSVWHWVPWMKWLNKNIKRKEINIDRWGFFIWQMVDEKILRDRNRILDALQRCLDWEPIMLVEENLSRDTTKWFRQYKKWSRSQKERESSWGDRVKCPFVGQKQVSLCHSIFTHPYNVILHILVTVVMIFSRVTSWLESWAQFA